MYAMTATVKSILVVEDDDLLRDFITDALTAAGFSVRSVPLAEQVPDILRSGTFDLIILDLGMPRGTVQGTEILARLREEEQWRQIPVIILSGYGDVVNRDVTAELGVKEILNKPLADFEELARSVRRTLGVG
jgi:DNA-binding response OmpR family regulator